MGKNKILNGELHKTEHPNGQQARVSQEMQIQAMEYHVNPPEGLKWKWQRLYRAWLGSREAGTLKSCLGECPLYKPFGKFLDSSLISLSTYIPMSQRFHAVACTLQRFVFTKERTTTFMHRLEPAQKSTDGQTDKWWDVAMRMNQPQLHVRRRIRNRKKANMKQINHTKST